MICLQALLMKIDAFHYIQLGTVYRYSVTLHTRVVGNKYYTDEKCEIHTTLWEYNMPFLIMQHIYTVKNV